MITFLANAFETDINVQTAIGLLLISLALALVVAGLLIIKFRFLDSERYAASNIVGVIMIAGGIILLLVSILGVIHVNFVM